jgi:hypothetical protein
VYYGTVSGHHLSHHPFIIGGVQWHCPRSGCIADTGYFTLRNADIHPNTLRNTNQYPCSDGYTDYFANQHSDQYADIHPNTDQHRHHHSIGNAYSSIANGKHYPVAE